MSLKTWPIVLPVGSRHCLWKGIRTIHNINISTSWRWGGGTQSNSTSDDSLIEVTASVMSSNVCQELLLRGAQNACRTYYLADKRRCIATDTFTGAANRGAHGSVCKPFPTMGSGAHL